MYSENSKRNHSHDLKVCPNFSNHKNYAHVKMGCIEGYIYPWKLFKTIFLKFLLRLFFEFFHFSKFLLLITCQFHSFVNQLQSNFLSESLSNVVVMGLGQLSSAQAIWVRILTGSNFFYILLQQAHQSYGLVLACLG